MDSHLKPSLTSLMNQQRIIKNRKLLIEPLLNRPKMILRPQNPKMIQKVVPLSQLDVSVDDDTRDAALQASQPVDFLFTPDGNRVAVCLVAPVVSKDPRFCVVCSQVFERSSPEACQFECNHWHHFQCAVKHLHIWGANCPACRKRTSNVFKVDPTRPPRGSFFRPFEPASLK